MKNKRKLYRTRAVPTVISDRETDKPPEQMRKNAYIGEYTDKELKGTRITLKSEYNVTGDGTSQGEFLNFPFSTNCCVVK